MSGGILPILTNVNPTPLWDTAGGSNAPDGRISSLYGYDQYTIYSSTFSDDSLTFTFANNYVEQQFLSDGSNYSRITNDTDGLLLEAYYVSTGIPLVAGTRDITLYTFNNLTGQQQRAGLDAATSSFFVSCVNGIVSETATMSNLNLSVLDLDGQIVTADPTDLLLNGVPIATSANISSLSEWAYDPAISTIQGNNNDLTGIRAGFFSSITANGIITENLTAISTIQNFNYISTQQVQTDVVSSLALNASTINGYTVDQLRSTTQDLVVSSLTTASFVSTAAVVASTFNGYTVGDFLSTSASQYNPDALFSTVIININGFISTPDLEVSSINGHEFNQNTVIISTVNTDSLVAVQISSLVGDVSLQLVSTLSFSASLGSNSFSLGGIDLGLGNIFSQITGGALGVMSLVTSGVALGTGVAALHQTRATNNINTTNYELVNGTTQLQVSTIPDYVSSIQRFNSGNPADQVIGQEIFISTLYPPGTFIRSMSDPLNTVSTPGSTIQAFGQWAPLSFQQTSFISSLEVDELVVGNGPGVIRGDPATSILYGMYNISTQTANIEYINGYNGNTVYFGNPAGSYIYFDTNPAAGGLQIDSSPPGNSFMNADKIATDLLETKNNSFISLAATVERLVGSNTNFLTSTVQIGPSTILTAENDFPGLAVRQVDDSSIAQVNASAFAVGDPNDTFQGAYTYAPTFDRAAVLNSSLITKYVAYLDDLSTVSTFVNVSTGTLTASSISILGLANSTITFGTAATAGTTGQPAGRLLVTGQDLDLGQNDLWVQQVRLGAGNPTNAQSEIVFYDANNGVRVLQTGLQDRTLRVGSTINTTAGGYLLDTGLNPPFFSTINNQINMMAFFPSTTNSTIGVSTISRINPVTNYGRSTLSGQSGTVTFTPAYADANEYSVYVSYAQTPSGNKPISATIVNTSTFTVDGDGNDNYFWQTIGRV